jgi:phosphotransferase system enzyme I (PtsP)
VLDALRKIVQEVNSAEEFNTVLEIIVSRVNAAMEAGTCSVYLRDIDTDRFVLSATEGLLQASVGKVSMNVEEGLVGLVARKAEPLNLEDAEAHPSFNYFPETGEEKFSSFLGAPIIHQRAVLGVLIVQRQKKSRFDESEEAFLVTISAQLAAVIAHAGATGELARATSAEKTSSDTEQIYVGLPSAPGIGIGTAVIVSSPADLYAVPRRMTDDIAHELEQFRNALESTKTDLRTVRSELSNKLNAEEVALFDVYISMLNDSSLGGEVANLIESGLSAQSAWSKVIIAHIRTFKQMDNPYLSERATDVRDLGRRVLGYLQELQPEDPNYPENTILIGEELAAPHLAGVPFDNIRGMISVRGSHNSHVAILGRAMGIPTIMGAVDLPWAELEGTKLIVDGYQGQIISAPTAPLLKFYKGVYQEEQSLAKDLEALKDEPNETADGKRFRLWVNTGLQLDTVLSLDRGAEGVGLYRTEVPFFLLDRFPTEEEQRLMYREQLEQFAPLPVTMRTLDIGGDKALPYFPIEEENPFLGWRGIRITLDHPEIFLAQLRAMMRASINLNNLNILLPMISNIQELDSAIELIKRAHHELTQEEGYQIELPHIGAMIEVPAAVYQIDEIARRVDFLSVGTNDLTQYLLAVDRNNPRVAELYHSFHPSLLNALRAIVNSAQAASCPVSVCGELAGDPLGAALLLGMGYEMLSMSSANLLKVKAVLRQLNMSELTEITNHVCALSDAAAIQDYLERALERPELSRLLHPAGTRVIQ